MTDHELACLMYAFRRMGADKLKVPEERYTPRVRMAEFLAAYDSHRFRH
jgi:hypothetical protein